jgi:hypothetical protein
MRSGVRSRTRSAIVVDADRARVAGHPDPARRRVVRDADRVVAGVERLQGLHVRRPELRHLPGLVVHDVQRATVGREREAARRAPGRDLRANRACPQVELRDAPLRVQRDGDVAAPSVSPQARRFSPCRRRARTRPTRRPRGERARSTPRRLDAGVSRDAARICVWSCRPSGTRRVDPAALFDGCEDLPCDARPAPALDDCAPSRRPERLAIRATQREHGVQPLV